MSEVAEFKWGEIAEFPPFKVAKSKSPQICSNRVPVPHIHRTVRCLMPPAGAQIRDLGGVEFMQELSVQNLYYCLNTITTDWFDAETQSDDLPPLNPAMPTSSFSYDPNANSGHAPYTGAGPSSSKQATDSLCPFGLAQPSLQFFHGSIISTTLRFSTSSHSAGQDISGAAPGDLRSGGEVCLDREKH
ncbi:hypothetical protein R3P38DRAFT_2806707 [Favolaschia claudopus]|uniref:Uncharacterized protein n=1 Tax=Favolaschia claudopus TaxID=2862362 RepID=A0AAV9ZIP2_9AGAR